MRNDLRASIEERLGKIIDLAEKRAKATKRIEDRIEELQKKLLAERQKLFDKCQPFNDQILGLNEELMDLAWSNQESLTTTEVKTAKFTNGEIRFRTNPPMVEIVDDALAVEELKEHKLLHLIYSLPDKTKILAEPESVDDLQTISVVQRKRLEIEALGCKVYTCYPLETQVKA